MYVCLLHICPLPFWLQLLYISLVSTVSAFARYTPFFHVLIVMGKYVWQVKNRDGQIVWRVQRCVKQKYHYLGTHPTERKAYLALQKKWPGERHLLTKENLANQDSRSFRRKTSGICESRVQPRREYQGISYEKSRPKPWKVRPGGPRFATQLEAAQCYVKQEGCTLASIRLEESMPPMRSLDDCHDEFRMGMLLQNIISPGDLEDIERRLLDKKSLKAFAKQPGVFPTLWVSKCSANRDIIVEEVLAIPIKRIAGKMGQSKATTTHLYDVFVACALRIAQTRWCHQWYLSVNKSQFHWMVFWEHLKRMGVLKNTPGSCKCGSKKLMFTDGPGVLFIQPLDDKLRVAMQHQIDFGAQVIKLEALPCANGQDVKNCVAALKNACPILDGAKTDGQYLNQWILRCAVFWIMRRSGVQKMNVQGFSVRQYMDLDFPDQKEQVLPLLSSPGMSQHQILGQDMAAALKALKYTGPPELLHMYACFFSNAEYLRIIRSKDAGWLKRNLPDMILWAKQHKEFHGVYPHVWQLLSAFQGCK